MPAGIDIEQLANAWQSVWRTDVLPQLSSTYHVLEYEVLRINTVSASVPVTIPPSFDVTYDDIATVLGDNNDYGGVAGDPMPTFTAIGMTKRTIIQGQIKTGAIRIGPRDETATKTGGLGSNEWTDVVQTANTTMANLLSSLIPYGVAPNNFETQMGLLSKTIASLAPPSPIDGYERLQTLRPSVFVTSQVSRKQRQ